MNQKAWSIADSYGGSLHWETREQMAREISGALDDAAAEGKRAVRDEITRLTQERDEARSARREAEDAREDTLRNFIDMRNRATAAEARVRRQQTKINALEEAIADEQDRTRARIAELEGALREMLRLRDGRIANDVAVDPIREVLTLTAPAPHPSHCRCQMCEQRQALATFTTPTGRGEVGDA